MLLPFVLFFPAFSFAFSHSIALVICCLCHRLWMGWMQRALTIYDSNAATMIWNFLIHCSLFVRSRLIWQQLHINALHWSNNIFTTTFKSMLHKALSSVSVCERSTNWYLVWLVNASPTDSTRIVNVLYIHFVRQLSVSPFANEKWLIFFAMKWISLSKIYKSRCIALYHSRRDGITYLFINK